MEFLKRITFDPEIMGGKPCLRGMRVGYRKARVQDAENCSGCQFRNNPFIAHMDSPK